MQDQSIHAAFLARRRANRRKRHPLPLDASLPGEEWRAIAGYEGVYEVSSRSRVRRIGYAPGAVTGRVLRQRGEDRYPFVGLYANGRGRKAYVHRLVADAFLGPIPDGHEVNHIDGDPSNAALFNLEIVTPSANKSHSWRVLNRRVGRVSRGADNGNSKLQPDAVLAIRAAEGRMSAKALARQYGVSDTLIRNIHLRRTWKHI